MTAARQRLATSNNSSSPLIAPPRRGRPSLERSAHEIQRVEKASSSAAVTRLFRPFSHSDTHTHMTYPFSMCNFLPWECVELLATAPTGLVALKCSTERRRDRRDDSAGCAIVNDCVHHRLTGRRGNTAELRRIRGSVCVLSFRARRASGAFLCAAPHKAYSG